MNLRKVALEMGNSAAMMMKHYFEIVDARAAREYWAINPLPRTEQKIATMGRR